jgi:hypothetical protein
MIKLKKPDWLKNNLGKVSERIGVQGLIQIDKIFGNKVFLRLIKEDGSCEVLPASNELSELLIHKELNPMVLKDYDIFELTDGYICISQTSSNKV